MPPVAITWIPATHAPMMVAATVVAPSPPPATATARLRRESLATGSRPRAEALDLGRRQADPQPAVHHRQGGRHGALGPDRLLHLQRGGHVVGGTASRGR